MNILTWGKIPAICSALLFLCGCYWTEYTGQDFPPGPADEEIPLYKPGVDEPDMSKYDIIGRMIVHGIYSRSYFHTEEYMMRQVRKHGGDAAILVDFGPHDYAFYPKNEDDFGTPRHTKGEKDPDFGVPDTLESNDIAYNTRGRMRVLVLKDKEAVKKHFGN